MRMQKIVSHRGARSTLWLFAAVLLVSVGSFVGRVSNSASRQPEKQLIPFPAECETTWNQLKVSIESTTRTKLVITRFTTVAPQYPNLAGFVEIVGVDKIDPSDLRGYLDTAQARCYASLRSTVSLDNPQFGRLLQLTLADVRSKASSPVYVTLEHDQLVLHYNEPL